MVDTHVPGAFTQSTPEEDSWESVFQCSEQLQQISGVVWPRAAEMSFPQMCQLSFVHDNLTELKGLWESLSPMHRAEFIGSYGNIADLMYVCVNEYALQALAQFWDPMLKCFTFGLFDLTPMIEEYQALISIPSNVGSKVYMCDQRLTLQRSLSKFLGNVHASDIRRQMKTKGEKNCIPIDYLIGLTRASLPERKGLSLLAMCIYGMVIFPRVKGYIEEEVIKLFVGIERGINPVIPILAETLRSLSYCRTQGKGKFFSCVPMLFIWLSSHLKYPREFNYPPIKFSNSWNSSRNTIKDFVSACWSPDVPNVDAWRFFLCHITLEEVIWRAPWLPSGPIIYRCGQLPFVLLLEPWGGIAYTPLLALRQVWLKQFVPIIPGLEDWEFSYDSNTASAQIHQAVEAWKIVRKMKKARHCEGATTPYENWRATRNGFEIVIPLESIASSDTLKMNQEANLEWLEERNLVLVRENEGLKDEIKRWVEHATSIQKQLDETKRQLKGQEKAGSSLNTEAVQMKKRNKKLQRAIELLEGETQAQKSHTRELNQEIKRLNGVIKGFQNTINEQATISQEVTASLQMEIEALQELTEEYRSQLTQAEHRNEVLQETAANLEHQLGIFRDASETITNEHAQLKEEHQEMSRDFTIWKDEYKILRLHYDGVRGQIEQGAEKLRLMARMADRFAERAMNLRRRITPTQPDGENLIRFLGVIGRDLGHFGSYH